MIQPILIVEDDRLQREMLSTLLHRKLAFKSHEAENGREALDIRPVAKVSGIPRESSL